MKIDIKNIDKKTYKKINEFREFLTLFGITEEDFNNLIELLKNKDQIVGRINDLTTDVKIIREKFEEKKDVKDETKDINHKNIMAELNKPAKGVNYGKQR